LSEVRAIRFTLAPQIRIIGDILIVCVISDGLR
jgi:hypothetical protein